MPTIEQLAADLQALQAWREQWDNKFRRWGVNGLNELNSGHGLQRFGDGTIRLDTHGMQMLKTSNPTPGDPGFRGVFWVDKFSNEPGFNANRAYVDGVAETGTGTIASLTAVYGSSATDGTGGQTAGIFPTALADGSQYVLVRHYLFLDPQSGDPAVFGDGMLWYSSTDNKLYARINGSTTELGAASSGGAVTPAFIDTYSPYSIGTQLAATAAAVPASATWPTANKALFIPFVLPADATVVKLWCMNGATASGNTDMGIYAEDGTKQISIGSTAQSGTSAIQAFDITDTPLTAGRYYLAIAKDDTTGTMLRTSTPVNVNSTKAFGIMEQTTAFALPSTATFASSTAGYVPWCGLSLRTVVA